MEQIKDTILAVIKGLDNKQKKSLLGDPQELLKKILTKDELRHIKVNYFRKGVLGINVDSSTWLYTLGLRKKDLLTRLQGESTEIKDIRWRIGETK